jgi:8-oxo-dGTP pyrophosphatase MutT (NUDIX family)
LSRFDALARVLAGRAPAQVDDPGRKLAAVAVVLAPDPASILLIRRAEREGDRWSGQMAFPGGRWSPGDPDLSATARRETREEVGLDLAGARLLGPLDDIAPRTQLLPPIIVRPFVFVAPGPAELSLNHEVAAAAWVELELLARPDTYRPFEYDALGTRLRFPGYHLDHGVVWGMTERILTPLLGMMGLVPDPATGRTG